MIFLGISITLVFAFSFLLSGHIKKFRLQVQEEFGSVIRFSSLPAHYVYCFILWSAIFSVTIFLTSFNDFTKDFLLFLLIGTSFLLIKFSHRRNFNAKKQIEKVSVFVLAITAGIGILITVAIALSIFVETLRFFELVNPLDFFFGTSWNPQMAINAEQSVGSGSFGIIPVFLGTLLVTLVAMFVAVPLGIMGAIYLCFYAKPQFRNYSKPALEILAGIPTVVYGYFAAIIIAPFFKHFFSFFGLEIASESAIAAGFVMGIMIIPFILSLTDDALNSVPQALKDGALAMGSTKSETIKKVVLPSAMPSIIGALILALSRAIGETMIVVMAAGLVAKLTINPLDSVTTATVQIVTLLTGDQEFDSPKTLAAFALAFTLFVFTFIFNIIALVVMKNFKKKYG